MKKYLLPIGLAFCVSLMAFGAKTNPQGVLTPVFSERFEAFVNGSETEPAAEELSADTKIDPALTGGLQWSGRGLHEAGGAMAIMKFEQSDWFGTEEVQGYVRTPYTDVRLDDGNFTVRFRARSLDGTASKIHVELYDAYTTNAIQTGTADITGEWASYEVDLCHPGYGNHLAYLELASEGEEWLIDDFEIVQDYYALSAPIIHFPRNVSYEQFTGRWNAVPLAESYLVSVYTRDENDNRTYLVKDKATSECTMTVDGTVKGTDYYYRVRSVNSQYTSEESDERKVHVPLNALETPVTAEAEDVSTEGFTARWEPTYRAMGYIIGLQREYIAKEDVSVTLVHEDFNKITSGDLSWPAPFYGNLDDITNLPGWQYNYFSVRVVAGMFGIDNSFKNYGEEAFLASPAIDLSGDSGKFAVALSVYGAKNDVVSVTVGDKTLTHTLETEGAQEFTLEFDNGTTSTVIRIEFDAVGETTTKMLFIDDIGISQSVHAGDTVKENIGTYKTETPVTSYQFTDLGASVGDTYIYTVTAWSYSLDEDGVWGPDIFSEASEPRKVVISDTSDIADTNIAATTISAAGNILTIVAAEPGFAEVYRIDGSLTGRYAIDAGSNTIAIESDGIVVVRANDKTARFLIRR